MNGLPKIAVVILNYNGLQHTVECLNSVRTSTYKPLSIVVVDNASTDDSVANLKGRLRPGELVELSCNGGYSYGNNVGVEYSFRNGAQYAFIINNDTVIDRNCIGYLYEAILQDERIGIVGPKVLYHSAPDIINFAGMEGCIHKAKYTRIGLDKRDGEEYQKLVDTFYQDGCALLISKTCYEKIGGFDDRLWTYNEETDLCLHAKMAGFRVCCLQKAKIWHKVSATLGRTYDEIKPHAEYYMEYYITRNQYIFHRRYAGSRLKAAWATAILLSRTPKRFVAIAVRRKKGKLRNIWMLIAGTLVGVLTDKKYPGDMFAPIKTVKRKSQLY